MSYLVLARKWRPRGFDDLVGQEPITRILKNAISQGRIAHAYLFSGPRGVGKTSSARILAKALNCTEGPTPVPCGVCGSCTAIAEGTSVDVIEIDGASNNSVDDIRDLRERVKYAPSGGRYKVYIIDEVHMLSGSAFNALLKTLEEPPSHVVFVLATTEMKKIPATVLSRCQHMPFRRISGTVIRQRLQAISGSEGISVSPAALALVARAADGSMRDSLTILDQIASFSSEITEENVKGLLGIADFGLLAKVGSALIAGDRPELLDSVNLLVEQGTDLRSFARELVQFFRDLLVASVMRDPEEVLDLSAEELATVKEITSSTSEDQLTLMLSEIMKAETDVRLASSPRLALEMALIRASFLSTMKPIKEVIARLDRYRTAAPSRPCGEAEQESYGVDIQPMERPKRKFDLGNPLPAPPAAPVEETPSEEPAPDIAAGAEDIADEELKEPESPPPQEQSAVREEAGGEKGAWERTVARIDPPLASKIVHAAAELKEDTLHLTLDGGHAVFEDSIRKNLKEIEKILAEEAGRRIGITLSASQKKSTRKKGLKEKVMEEPLIREALELFEGRVVEISPLTSSEKNGKNGGDHV
jgi:DNA polymerase-3 subunit gamma/tau